MTLIYSGNYKNIGNNFISGGYNPIPSPQQQQQQPVVRQTRSNMSSGFPSQPPMAPSNVIKVINKHPEVQDPYKMLENIRRRRHIAIFIDFS